jgi:hypothetical protein
MIAHGVFDSEALNLCMLRWIKLWWRFRRTNELPKLGRGSHGPS